MRTFHTSGVVTSNNFLKRPNQVIHSTTINMYSNEESSQPSYQNSLNRRNSIYHRKSSVSSSKDNKPNKRKVSRKLENSHELPDDNSELDSLL